jgi:hypothetical protein
MRRKRFTEGQIIGTLKEADACGGGRGHRAGNQPWPSRTPRTAKAMASTSMAMAMSATCSS